jgi:hypothetical protein
MRADRADLGCGIRAGLKFGRMPPPGVATRASMQRIGWSVTQ